MSPTTWGLDAPVNRMLVEPQHGAACVHGQLARSCNICELEAEVKRLTAELADRQAAVDKAVKAERAACANICDDWHDLCGVDPMFQTHADRIRARSKP